MGKGSRIRQKRDVYIPESAKAKEEPKTFWSRFGWKIFVGVMLFLVLATLVFTIVYSTGYLQRNTTALQIGDAKITPMEYKVYYSLIRSNYISNNYDTLYSYYGNSLSQLDSLTYINDTTRSWGAYFSELTIDTLTQYYILYQEGVKAGHVMSGDMQAQLDDNLSQMKTAADSMGVSVEEYIKTALSKQATYADIEQIFQRRYYAQSYMESLRNSYTFTGDQLNEYYKENSDNYDSVHYRSFSFPYEEVTYTEPKEGEKVEQKASSQEEADKMTAENKAKAEALAKEFQGKITDEQSFVALASEYAAEADKETYKDPSATLVTGSSLSSSNSDAAVWYKDASRKAGDTTIIENSQNYQVLYFVDRYLADTRTASVRHILLRTEETPTDATDEQKKQIEEKNSAIKSQAEELYASWKSGEATEESFAKLARENSADTGSVANGGLYKEFAQNTMTKEFNDWSFDTARKPGDTGIVQTSYGYHIMYFVAEGRPYWIVDSESNLRDQALNDYFTEKAQAYPIKVNTYPLSMA